jgi:8-oxo-dGTP pyrophosphatase MutT (NUDIX family)
MVEGTEQLIESGSWGDNTSWEIYLSSMTPSIGLVTAVACVAISNTETNEVVLTRNQRGWEVLAGHIKEGESPLEALSREALEEGGFEISKTVPFGYRKITALKRPGPESRAFNYPFPVSYIAYFLAYTERPLKAVTGEEIIESRAFSVIDRQKLVDNGDLNELEQTIINLGLLSVSQNF